VIRADELARVLRNLQQWVRFDIDFEQEHNDDSEFWQRRALANQGALDLVGRLADTFLNEFASMRSYELNVPKWTCQPIVRSVWRLPRWPRDKPTEGES